MAAGNLYCYVDESGCLQQLSGIKLALCLIYLRTTSINL